ncbi:MULTISPECIES: hypothetical protein [Helicobacter]|uniref:Lipoprotein n=1 Tax=Helicobacter ibis TaxID=2962633 RepID=A0ABT4VFZ9_9HELI|nr:MULTISPECIES: hypothetical protein [Helicobacter]MDA3967966.1 hypothetical protein [Helicobacter sp. WB40]MDA3969634.1 hypothetical protein [Helicobacter ibis]
MFKRMIFMGFVFVFSGCDVGEEKLKDMAKDSGITDVLKDSLNEVDKFLEDNKTQDFINNQMDNLKKGIDKLESYLDSNATSKKDMETISL